MSEKESHKAEVLLARRDRYSDGEPLLGNSLFFSPNWENTYSLLVDDEYVRGNKNGKPEEVAARFATTLKERGLSDYSLVNGERIRCTNGKRVRVFPMLPDDVATFKNTLDAILRE